MARDLTRLDLARFHAARLELRAEIEVALPQSAEIFSAIGTSGPDDRRAQVFATEYRRSRTQYRCTGFILQSEPSAENYHFVLEYFTLPGTSRLIGGSMPEDAPATMDVLEALSNLDARQTFNCDINFEYPRERYRSKVSLPLTMEHSHTLPWTQIQGIHFSSSRNGLPLYDVIVDHGRTDSDEVVHMVSFAYSEVFALDLPSRVLHKGNEISLSFAALS